jgi:hypothetical protein
MPRKMACRFEPRIDPDQTVRRRAQIATGYRLLPFLSERADRVRIEPPTYPDTSEFHGAAVRAGHWRSFMESRMNIMNGNLDLKE